MAKKTGGHEQKTILLTQLPTFSVVIWTELLGADVNLTVSKKICVRKPYSEKKKKL